MSWRIARRSVRASGRDVLEVVKRQPTAEHEAVNPTDAKDTEHVLSQKLINAP